MRGLEHGHLVTSVARAREAKTAYERELAPMLEARGGGQRTACPAAQSDASGEPGHQRRGRGLLQGDPGAQSQAARALARDRGFAIDVEIQTIAGQDGEDLDPASGMGRAAGRWHQSVGPQSFRFAVSVLTLIAFLLAVWTHIRGSGSLGHYLLLAYALGQGLNVFVPHVFATIATRTYMPGLLSGILFVLPAASVLLFRAFVVGNLVIGRFLIVAVIFIPLMVLSIPILFRIGGTVGRFAI